MLTSYTSSEEEKISHLRKFAQNIRNNMVVGCLKIPLTSMHDDRFGSCENAVPWFQTSSILPSPPNPPNWFLDPV